MHTTARHRAQQYVSSTVTQPALKALYLMKKADIVNAECEEDMIKMMPVGLKCGVKLNQILKMSPFLQKNCLHNPKVCTVPFSTKQNKTKMSSSL